MIHIVEYAVIKEERAMDLYCLGEMLIDFIPGSEPDSYIKNAGGGPPNVAIAAARNGVQCGFCGKLGDDDFGRFLIQTLEENHVEPLCRELTKEAVTTLAFVSLQPSGERSFTFARKPGADMLLRIEDVREEDIANSRIVHTTSCSLSKGSLVAATKYAMKTAHELNKLVSFDVNYRHHMWDDDIEGATREVFDILKYTDLLKISEEEVDMLGGEEQIPCIMAEKKIALVVLTLGADGARCYFNDQVFGVAGRKAQAVDTTGAGDSFWGGFLSKLLLGGVHRVDDLNEQGIVEAMAFGNVAGWLCVQKKGAITSLPTRAETEAVLRGEATNA